MQCAAYQLARNVDYFQLGNEAFEATGEFWIEEGQLPEPDDEYSGPISGVPLSAADEACTLVLDWLEAEANAARRGSALAGRPLRIVGPAMLLNELNDARQQSNSEGSRSAREVKCVFERVNEFADIVGIHLHHQLDADLDGKIDPVLDWLVATSGTWLVTEGVRPKALGCTEWGAWTSSGWEAVHRGQAILYYYEENPEFCDDEPEIEYWHDFVQANWIDADEGISPDETGFLGIPQILDMMADAGLIFGCYGGYATFGACNGGSGNSNNQFDPSSLWAADCVIADERIEDPTGEDRFGPVRTLYEGEADLYYFTDLGIVHPEELEDLTCD